MNKQKNFRIAMAMALTVLPSLLLAQSASIGSVDNYAGNSNVYTNAPNTEIKIIELDADKKPVRSWTGKTDANGKITIPAGSNLSLPYLKIEVLKSQVEGIVVPSQVYDKQPFTFSVPGTVEGEVVDIKTVEGEVVAHPKPDKMGRVFLPAGLAAGAYLLCSNEGRSHQVGMIHVGNPQDPCAPGPMKFASPSLPIKTNELVHIAGTGFNPNAGSMEAALAGQRLNVLASTPTEMTLASPSSMGMKPGLMGKLEVKDLASSQVTDAPGYTYEVQSHLSQVKVVSGSETHLIVNVMPKNVMMTVSAQILSGPVTFENRQNKMSMATKDGIADFLICSIPGSAGPFNVNYYTDPWAWMGTDGWVPIPIEPNIIGQDAKPGSRKRGHTIGGGTANPGGWTDEYTDFDADGNPIGHSSETYDGNGTMRERKTNHVKDGNGTIKTETFDKDGKWTGTTEETFKDGKQTGGTKTTPDGKGGSTTQNWDSKTGTYK